MRNLCGDHTYRNGSTKYFHIDISEYSHNTFSFILELNLATSAGIVRVAPLPLRVYIYS